MSDPVLVIAGPTASGKSALAVDVAEEFTGTVINADSMQVYRELRVLTARPGPADEARVPHRLFGVLPVTEACSAGWWLEMAVREIEDAQARGRLPVVAGGTGLYLKVLGEGLAAVPDIPAQVRREALALHARLGGEAFLAELARLDAEAAGRLAAGDSQRLVRAYEVVVATGRPLAYWHALPGAVAAAEARFATIVLLPPRQALYAAIDARFDAMMAAGALDEVAALEAFDPGPSLPAMKALGIRELRRHLEGEIGLADAVEEAKRASRNYAKRQLTWLRHQMTPTHTVEAQYSESMQPEIFSFIRRFLLTGQT